MIMKQLIQKVKLISILLLVISFVGCENDDVELPKVISGFTHTINAETGTVTFINTSVNSRNYFWSFGDGTSSTEINPIKTYSVGEYNVTLKATNVAGASDTSEDIVVISDVGAPIITLLGDTTINIALGGTFTDPGATATDDVGGDLTASIVIAGDVVDVNTAGTYIITYNVSDAAGNAATQRTRTVIVNEADPCVADTAQSFAASSFNISFKTDPGTTETVGETDKLLLGEVGYEYLDNPDFDNAVNSSCKVAKIDKAAGANYANVQIFTADKFNLTDNAGFKLKIFSPNVGTKVLFKLEDTNNGGINNQVSQLTTIANGWEELTFDFPESDTNKFNRIIIFFGFEQGDALTIHFDELKTYTRTGGGGGTGGCTGTLIRAVDFPVDFEGCETFMATNGDVKFGDAISAELADNPSPTGINTSAYVLKVDKPAGASHWEGIQNAFAADFNSSLTFKVKIYSTLPNIEFQFEISNDPNEPGVGNPTPIKKTVTNANVWTEVEVTFTGVPPGGHNNFVIKPNDIGGGTVPISGIYYFDDVRLE